MITYLIIGITVLVSFYCFNNVQWFYKLALTPYRVVHNKEWYRVLTHGFVHADTMHLVVNMFTLWSFGTYIESYYKAIGLGAWGYLGLYIGGLFFSSIYDLIKRKNDPYYTSIGASGAVSAVLFSAIFLNPWSKILFFAVLPVPGIVFGVLYLIYCQFMGKKVGDRINHNAHFYGAVFGVLYPALLEPSLITHFINQLIP